jgi:hypothetical protein
MDMKRLSTQVLMLLLSRRMSNFVVYGSVHTYGVFG